MQIENVILGFKTYFAVILLYDIAQAFGSIAMMLGILVGGLRKTVLNRAISIEVVGDMDGDKAVFLCYGKADDAHFWIRQFEDCFNCVLQGIVEKGILIGGR